MDMGPKLASKIILTSSQYPLLELKMTKSRWWFSPLKIDDTGNELLPSAHKVHEKSEKLNNASAFSVDMRRVFVNKSYDKNDGLRKYAPDKLKEFFHKAEITNDLLIVSNFQTGTAPIVSGFII